MEKRKFITVVLDNNNNLIVKHHKNAKHCLAASLVYTRDENENKIKYAHIYDSDDYDNNLYNFYGDIAKDICNYFDATLENNTHNDPNTQKRTPL